MVEYYRSLLARVPTLLLESNNRLTDVVSLIVFLLVLINQKLAKLAMITWGGISPWWSALVVASLVVWGLAKANYDQIEKRDDQIREAGRLAKVPAIPDELLASHLRGLTFRIMDLAREGDTIRNRVFEDCYIYGPALVHLDGCTLVKDTFDGNPDAIFVATSNTTVMGAIQLQNCTMLRCRVSRIGFIGSQAQIDEMKKGFTAGS